MEGELEPTLGLEDFRFDLGRGREVLVLAEQSPGLVEDVRTLIHVGPCAESQRGPKKGNAWK